jgi:hypothetical protein
MVLTGGVDSNALQRPKRFLGAARNVEEGGSLIIIGTALIDTSSRMDKVIFEEFKGTGNSEIHLDRRLYERRVFSSIQLNRSGTRREELLLAPDILKKTWVLRQAMYNMDEIGSMELMLKSMLATKTNVDFFDMMRRGAQPAFLGKGLSSRDRPFLGLQHEAFDGAAPFKCERQHRSHPKQVRCLPKLQGSRNLLAKATTLARSAT